MRLNPYLIFNGQCEAAFKFYEKCLDGKNQMKLTYGESPMAEQVPADWRDKIIHATLIIGESTLQGADAAPGHYDAPKGFFVTLQLKDQVAGERIFNELSEKGKVELPFQPTFWAAGFGMCVDQFGIPWMVNCGQAH